MKFVILIIILLVYPKSINNIIKFLFNMINNIKSKIVSLFLSKDNKEKIEKENNLILSLRDKYKEFHVYH